MRFKLFEKHPSLKYGLSEKVDGSMKISSEALNNLNRMRFFDYSGLPAVVSAGIVHGNITAKVTMADNNRVIPIADGLVTNERNLFLTVTVADCFPVYFFDSSQNAVGLAHAGWKGTLAGIIPATLIKLQQEYGSSPLNILCTVGPGIQKHHFEIKKDVLGRFKRYQRFMESSKKIMVDLPGIIKQQILDFGVPDNNVEVSAECTYCQKNKYFSFRRDSFGVTQGRPERSRGGDKPLTLEAMAAYIGLNL